VLTRERLNCRLGRGRCRDNIYGMDDECLVYCSIIFCRPVCCTQIVGVFYDSELVIVVYRQMSNFSAIPWREQVTFDEMMMISALYYINTRSWIF
jgi:hypothetical protein